jgi:hypothetical protein
MGTRIRADLFLTARHCLQQFDPTLGWQPRAVKDMHLRLVGQPQLELELRASTCRGSASGPDCSAASVDPVTADHLVLQIVAPGRSARDLPPMPELLFERPAPKQFLVVPGYSTWFTGRPWAPGDRPLATAPAIDGCVITEVAKDCVVNACQSDAGYSGSPMFARRNVDQLVMVGIFLGSATAYPTCMRGDRNFGASLPRDVALTLAGPVARARP